MAEFRPGDLYVAPNGSSRWTGFLAEPNADKSDGPLATLDDARKQVRELKKRGRLTGPVTVWIREGRYTLNKPIFFDGSDAASVTYAAYPGETPVLDGGTRVTDWSEEEVNGATVWVADMSVFVHDRGVFRSLFVNGERRPRSRWPKEGWLDMEDVPDVDQSAGLFEGSTRFTAKAGDFREWHNLEDVEVVASHYWIEERMPVTAYDQEKRLVSSSKRSIFALKWGGGGAKWARYYVDNVFETLGAPGEWYLDSASGKLYYVPKPGETPDTVEVVVPHLLQFTRLVGDIDGNRLVHDITFRGLTFEYSDWRQPDGWGTWYDPETPPETWRHRDSFNHFDRNNMQNLAKKPGTDYAAVPQGAQNVPGAIMLQGARNCAVVDCRIAHVGWYGIDLGEGCSGNRLVGNTVEDIGAGGIKLDGTDADGAPNRRCRSNVITDNHIHAGGRVFLSGIGIMLVHSGHNIVAHNEIHDLFYTGISVGYVWTQEESVTRENRILKNHIYNLGQKVLSDMGGIYTLGVAPGTVIKGNLIHDIEKANYGGWGIYPDESSSFLLVEDNIVYNTSSQGLHEHWGRQNIYRNNIWAFGGEGVIILSRENHHAWVDWPEHGCTFERNICLSKDQPIFMDRQRYLDTGRLFSDLNLYWDLANPAPAVWHYQAGGQEPIDHDLTGLRDHGLDRHSKVADPKFAAPESGDFTLAEDSPALDLGFRPIDMSDVGVRPPEARMP